jgi:hypothetical protein
MLACLFCSRRYAVPRKVIQSMAYSLNWTTQMGLGSPSDRVKME